MSDLTFVQSELLKLADEKNADFQRKLTPGIAPETFLGVRVPAARNLAKTIEKSEECEKFLHTLPHKYYDENILHACMISRIKPYEKCLEEIEHFLPYVDNWAVCDILSPKIFGKHKDQLIGKIYEWAGSPETYTCRFGIEMLMTFYLDGDFKAEYLEIPAAADSEEYYVKMMVAWYFATALAKQWDATIPYLEQKRLPVWTHNKTIQKARESYRITPEQKEYLKTLKR
ncbi:MAG: DNA alkylation repair protein [Dorea sp.]|nr:DNA alkylation repair protein [Dorea sp.]